MVEWQKGLVALFMLGTNLVDITLEEINLYSVILYLEVRESFSVNIHIYIFYIVSS